MELQYGEYKEIAQDPVFKVKVKDLRKKNGLSKKEIIRCSWNYKEYHQRY